MTPSAATKAALEAMGYHAGRVEQTIPMTRPGKDGKDVRASFTRDLFGFADWVGVHRKGIIWVQATASPHASEHRVKLLMNATARDIALSEFQYVELWHVSKRVVGGKKVRMIVRERMKHDGLGFEFVTMGAVSVREVTRLGKRKAQVEEAGPASEVRGGGNGDVRGGGEDVPDQETVPETRP